ncbi:MAG: hypothetical protein L3J24_10995 [Xanthomonadales bacterium]|nr:hypothetical protein [Xanthomonadales bacterium]
MPLFHEKVILKALSSRSQTIPSEHLTVLQSWKEKIENGSLENQNEVAIHAPFTQHIMAQVLGYTPFGSSEN